MRIEPHISKVCLRWHIHLIMDEWEFEQQKIRHVECVADLDKLKVPVNIKENLIIALQHGAVYIEVKKETT